MQLRIQHGRIHADTLVWQQGALVKAAVKPADPPAIKDLPLAAPFPVIDTQPDGPPSAPKRVPNLPQLHLSAWNEAPSKRPRVPLTRAETRLLVSLCIVALLVLAASVWTAFQISRFSPTTMESPASNPAGSAAAAVGR